MPPLLASIANTLLFLISIITSLLTLFALHSKLHTVLLCLFDAFYASTTPVWRVETLYPVLLKLAASTTTVVMLMRMCGLVLRTVVGDAWGGRTRKTGPAILYVYPRVQFLRQPVPSHPRCAVCLCEGSSNAVLECGHAFHWGCVRPWLDRKNTCPLCARRQMRRGVDADGHTVME